jgi:hypothetical protein
LIQPVRYLTPATSNARVQSANEALLETRLDIRESLLKDPVEVIPPARFKLFANAVYLQLPGSSDLLAGERLGFLDRRS